jgi:hypothetical protein
VHASRRDALTPTWSAWLSNTTQTEADFIGQAGHSYYFQVRVTHNVSNTSAWVKSGSVVVSAVTKYYHRTQQATLPALVAQA